MRSATRLLGQEKENIPKGYDLETSFYHYSLDLAIEMYVNDKTMVPAVENNYPYPFPVPKSNGFAKFFGDDEKTRLSRAGAQLIIMDGHARFSHKSIMEYFAARVFYEEIKWYQMLN